MYNLSYYRNATLEREEYAHRQDAHADRLQGLKEAREAINSRNANGEITRAQELILRGHTGFFHAASLGKSAFAAVEAGPESPGGATLVRRLTINLTLDMYTCASLDG